MDDSLGRLYQQVIDAKSGDPNLSRTAKLMRSGRASDIGISIVSGGIGKIELSRNEMTPISQVA